MKQTTDKKIKLSNDGTLKYHMVKHMKDLAEKTSMDLFSVWFVEKIIIPYKREDGMCEWISEMIGFKKVPTIDKIYWRLKELEL